MTTYNIDPEEKQRIYNIEYNKLQQNNVQLPTVDVGKQNAFTYVQPKEKKLIQEVVEKEVVKSEVEPKIEEPVVQPVVQPVVAQPKKQVDIVKANGEKGQNEDMPDYQTQFNNIVRKAKQASTIRNDFTDQIDEVKHWSDEDKTYLKILAYLESGFNVQAKNRFGYMGAYQFGTAALHDVGLDEESYMASGPTGQQDAAIRYGKQNIKQFYKYIGKQVGGITLTRNGLMAASHLLGQGNLKKYLESDGKEVFVDGNNVPITAYLEQFV